MEAFAGEPGFEVVGKAWGRGVTGDGGHAAENGAARARVQPRTVAIHGERRTAWRGKRSAKAAPRLVALAHGPADAPLDRPGGIVYSPRAMPELLLELFSEEIPARMQRRAAEDLRKLVTDALVEGGFLYEGARAYATPRRLTLHVVGLPPEGKSVREERRGPSVGAPEAATAGFLRSAGLLSLAEARVESSPKGDFYMALVERPGRRTTAVLAEILPSIARGFPWPKSMRWGAASREAGSLRWVRPLHAILCTFGPEGEDPDVVRFAVDGIESGDVTFGHRFHAPGPIRAKHFSDYAASLERARVVLDADRRKDMILHDARDLAFARGLELVEDEGLLEEVAGLVEWPVTLMGTFDEAFLAMPPEVIRATIRANQKCFVTRLPSPLQGGVGGGGRGPESDAPRVGATPGEPAPDAGTLSVDARPSGTTPTPHPSPQGRGELANAFVLVSNIAATDGGQAVVQGNERVVRARLADARFFWETDLKVPLEDRLEKLKSVVFHEKLGTQFERVERIAALARELAPVVGADPDLAQRAARLAKADLTTEMVGEFPELQGLMGRYYAAARASRRASVPRSRSTTSRSGRRIGCRPTRCRSPWRWRTRSTRSWGSGPSTRSRRDRRTRIR